MAAPQGRRILILRHADTIQTTFGQNWLSFYDPMSNGLKVPPNTPYNCDYTPVPDVNLPTCLPWRADGFDAWAADSCLSESGKLTAVAVGQYMKKSKLTPETFGRKLFCSPTYAAIETANALIDGLLGTSKEKMDICVENGLFTCPTRFRVLPSFVDVADLAQHYPNRIDETYRSIVPRDKMSVKEAVSSFYVKNRDVLGQILQKHKSKYLLMVTHGSNMEAMCRTIRQMTPLDDGNFSRCVEGIPFLADACLGEEKVGGKMVWKLVESPLLRFSQVGNEKQEDWAWLNLDEQKLKQKFK